MSEAQEPRDLEGVFGKLSMLSRVLGEVEDWLETRGPKPGAGEPQPGKRVVSLATLDLYLSRERARS